VRSGQDPARRQVHDRLVRAAHWPVHDDGESLTPQRVAGLPSEDYRLWRLAQDEDPYFIKSNLSTPRSGVVNLERLNTLRPQDYNIEVMSTLKSWCKPDGKQRAPFI
jgi:hypothetical protein